MARRPRRTDDAQLSLFGALGLGQVGLGQVGLGQVGLGQVGLGQVGPGQLGPFEPPPPSDPASADGSPWSASPDARPGIHLYRSQRVERLADALSAAVARALPSDPFEALPIVVGSRGMERWLRHELATSLGIASRLEFLFPRRAFEGAASWLVASEAPALHTPFWEGVTDEADPWRGPLLAARVLRALRALRAPRAPGAADDDFEPVRHYLGQGESESVGAREVELAREVASTVERLLHDRPHDVRRWTKGEPGEPAWIARLVAQLHASRDAGPSPADRLFELLEARPRGVRRALFVFGLSTLRPGDQARLAALARHLPVHLFLLAPSREWWGDLRPRLELVRRIRAATDAAARAELTAELRDANALLSTSGAPSRDLQCWLEDVGYHPALSDEPGEATPAPTSLLQTLQQWVDAAAPNPAPPSTRGGGEHAAEAPPCPSVQLHACHGALRQCEALRDALLGLFASHPDLEPRHVLVMTPDVATYAPLLHAVLTRRGPASEGPPAIPVHVADLGLRSTNALADALLHVLGLAAERVTASRLLEVVSLWPVRARFGLADDDLAALTELVVESGLRWGWDAADRERHGQPALDQNTVRFGLERLALGALLHDPGELHVAHEGGESERGPAVPYELVTRERVERFGRLAHACDALRAAERTLREPGTAVEWRARLAAALDDLTQVDEDTQWLRTELEASLDELLPAEGEAREACEPHEAAPIVYDRDAVVALLRGSFELPTRGDRPITGAVTVSGMEPMRSVPFRVIAMVGMDDRAFPRRGRLAAWDPFAARRPGEHDRRDVDRHLFLEALLCARDALLVFGTGFEPKQGEPVPLAVPVTELAEVVAAHVGLEPDLVVRRHPLQPWSDGGTFDPAWRDGPPAERVSGLAATAASASWPSDPAGDSGAAPIDVPSLARALAKPQKELLSRRLGLVLDTSSREVHDREPLELAGLDKWQLRHRSLAAVLDPAVSPDAHAPTRLAAQLSARLRAEGALPLEAGGEGALATAFDEVTRVRVLLDGLVGAHRLGPRAACVRVGGRELRALAPDVRQVGAGEVLVWSSASEQPSDALLLEAWYTLLVLRVSGDRPAKAHLVGLKKSCVLEALAAPKAEEALGHALVAYDAVRAGPVPLFDRLSRGLVEQALRKKRAFRAREALSQLEGDWVGSSWKPGLVDDPWVEPLFGHLSLDDLADRCDELLARARPVWEPLLTRGGLYMKKHPARPGGEP